MVFPDAFIFLGLALLLFSAPWIRDVWHWWSHGKRRDL